MASPLVAGEFRNIGGEDLEIGYNTATSAGRVVSTKDNATTLELRWVDVRAYGAATTASATTNLAAFNTAIGTGNVTVIVPPGAYSIDSPGIDIKDNTTIIGIGNPTLTGTNYIMNINRGKGGTADPSLNIKNVTIRGITFLHAGGFSEHIHQLNANAVTNLLVEGCTFKAFRGDGIYIGSSNSAATERHNQSVIIRNNVFDGVNNDNRNGISVIDGSGVVIEGNYFKNTTKSGMPGAIDIEPDANLFARIRNIVIKKNYITNSGQDGISVYLPDSFNIPTYGIVIADNYVEKCARWGIVYAQSNGTNVLTQSSSSHVILIQGNSVKNCGKPFLIYGVKGASIKNNSFENTAGPLTLGDSSYERIKSFDVEFSGNKLTRIGMDNGYSVIIDGITNLTLNNNIFTDCGDDTRNGACVNFNPSFPGAIKNITIIGNSFFKTNLTNMKATVGKRAGSRGGRRYRIENLR